MKAKKVEKVKLYDILIDGRKFKVRGFLSGGQIKRLAGCDNKSYGAHISDPLPRWIEQEGKYPMLTEDEEVDLGELEHYKHKLEFHTQRYHG